jgi:hypothetical protein
MVCRWYTFWTVAVLRIHESDIQFNRLDVLREEHKRHIEVELDLCRTRKETNPGAAITMDPWHHHPHPQLPPRSLTFTFTRALASC